MQHTLFIEADGQLCRGFSRSSPALLWNMAGGCWGSSTGLCSSAADMGKLVTSRLAKRLYPIAAGPAPDVGRADCRVQRRRVSRYRPELCDGYRGPRSRRVKRTRGREPAHCRRRSQQGQRQVGRHRS